MGIVKVIFSVGITLLWLIIVTAIVITFITYSSDMNKDRYRIFADELDHQCIKKLPVLKFKSFIEFYSINPDSWYLGNGWVSKMNLHSLSRYVNPWPLIKDKSPCFKFNFIDYWRYRYWKGNKEKTKERYNKKQNDAEALKNLLNMVQEDINREKEKAETMINQSIEDMNAALAEKTVLTTGDASYPTKDTVPTATRFVIRNNPINNSSHSSPYREIFQYKKYFT